MVEYGRVTGETTSRGGGGGGGSIDVGGGVMDFVNNTVDQVASMPPEQLLLIGIVLFVGLLILRR